MISSVAKKTRSIPIADANRACSNRESRKDKYGNGVLSTEDRVHII